MIKEIVKQADKLGYMTILPAKESLMLSNGDIYQTGSDYTTEMLNTSIEDIEEINNQ